MTGRMGGGFSWLVACGWKEAGGWGMKKSHKEPQI